MNKELENTPVYKYSIMYHCLHELSSSPQCPSAIAASPFPRLRSRPAPLPREPESSRHIPLSPASGRIPVVPLHGLDSVDMLNICQIILFVGKDSFLAKKVKQR